VTGRRAVMVLPECPEPARSGNAWRDLQQVHILRTLGFEVHVIAARRRWDLSDEDEAAAAGRLPASLSYLSHARTEPREPLLERATRKARYLTYGTDHPFGWWLPPGLPRAVESLGIDGGPVDVLLIRSIFVHEIPALRRLWRGRIVVDCHDSDVHLAGELLKTVRGAARLGPWANLAGIRRSVARHFPLADELWAVSPQDAARVAGETAGVRVLVVPSGMDEREAAPSAQPGVDDSALFVANFGYGPNARGAAWLLRHVWPSVRARKPAARLWCVGGRMPRALSQLAAAAAGVEVLGHVADFSRALREAGVVVAPVIEGGGTRVKIVEAWSQGKAVVTTSKGIEGLPWVDHAVAVADRAADFATMMVDLMRDGARRTEMGHAALLQFRQSLSWAVAVRAVAAGSLIQQTAGTPHASV
jgi:glycosyltransferase involved in cell wall biosynthesis